jgi:hypothetical protein
MAYKNTSAEIDGHAYKLAYAIERWAKAFPREIKTQLLAYYAKNKRLTREASIASQ